MMHLLDQSMLFVQVVGDGRSNYNVELLMFGLHMTSHSMFIVGATSMQFGATYIHLMVTVYLS